MNFSEMKQWLLSKKWSAHTLVAAWASANALYFSVPAVKVLVDSTYGHVPSAGKAVLNAAVGALAFYLSPIKKVASPTQ